MEPRWKAWKVSQQFEKLQTIRQTGRYLVPFQYTSLAAPQQCPVCDNRDPVAGGPAYHLPCGHRYCEPCLVAQLTSECPFPMECLGNRGRCHSTMKLWYLKTTIPWRTLLRILRRASFVILRYSPRQFFPCPGPECTGLFKWTRDGLRVCTTCFRHVCTKCRTLAHESQSCSECVDAQIQELQQVMQSSERRDILACLGCRTLVSKEDGVENLVCPGCGHDICKTCEVVFQDASALKRHVARDHAGIIAGIEMISSSQSNGKSPDKECSSETDDRQQLGSAEITGQARMMSVSNEEDGMLQSCWLDIRKPDPFSGVIKVYKQLP